MVSMTNLSLRELAGMWVSSDCNVSMWITLEANHVEVYYDRRVVVSEPLNFLYDKERNIRKISDSVLLYQLFEIDEILIRITIGDKICDFFLKKR